MPISKSEKGKKRVCENCSCRWYDLNKSPIICPVCKQEFQDNDLANFTFNNSQTYVTKNKISEDSKDQLVSEKDMNDINSDEEDNDLISLDEMEAEEQNS